MKKIMWSILVVACIGLFACNSSNETKQVKVKELPTVMDQINKYAKEKAKCVKEKAIEFKDYTKEKYYALEDYTKDKYPVLKYQAVSVSIFLSETAGEYWKATIKFIDEKRGIKHHEKVKNEKI